MSNINLFFIFLHRIKSLLSLFVAFPIVTEHLTPNHRVLTIASGMLIDRLRDINVSLPVHELSDLGAEHEDTGLLVTVTTS